MKKFICSVCGYIHEGESAPEKCPQCGAPASKFNEQPAGDVVYATEHVVGIASGAPADILEGLNQHFAGECTEVGMYLAMSRVAEREGYPEVAEAYKRIAFEEADHAARIGELLGTVITPSTKKNLELRAAAEHGACAGKMEIARRAKEENLDAIHDTIHEMAKDEARHGSAFAGLLKRHFGG